MKKSVLAFFLSVLAVAVSAETLPGTLLRRSVADPCLLYEDGVFYLTMTGSRNIALVQGRSLAELSEGTQPLRTVDLIYRSAEDPTVRQLYGKDAELNGTWSPEIHHISEDDLPGYGGWYLFLTLRKKDVVGGKPSSAYIRMVVLKSVSGTPAGPYVHPVSGGRGASQPFLDVRGRVYDVWAGGLSMLKIPSGRHKGLYAMWIEEEGRGQGYGAFYQKIMMARMETPWKMAGKPSVVTYPTQQWEEKGADGRLPMVVEGGTAVYGDHGEIFLAYCGSGYWSDYGLGQLTLKMDGDGYADPLRTSSWIKYEANPLFTSRKSDDLRGAGHATFLKDAAGRRFMCYHAYPFVDGEKIRRRNAYIEPYSIDYEAISPTSPLGVIRFGLLGCGVSAPVGSEITFVTD